MTRKNLVRGLSATVVTGFATLAFAAPANAQEVPSPDSGRPTGDSGISISAPDGPWMELTVGVGGLALVGAGVAAAGSRRHHRHTAHPA